MMFATLVVVLLLSTTTAFVPSSAMSRSTLELNAMMDRRDAFGVALAGLFSLTGGVLPADAANPALETFKGRKKTKGSFIPGKGLHQHDVIVASNPGTCVGVSCFSQTNGRFVWSALFCCFKYYSARNIQGREKDERILYSWKGPSSTRR
jgi:hypothetical protein